MKVVILYRPESEMARPVETFVHDFQNRHSQAKIELMNIDEREAIAIASLYDIVSFPAIMVTAIDGTLLHLWQGKQLPLINEVAAYLQN